MIDGDNIDDVDDDVDEIAIYDGIQRDKNLKYENTSILTIVPKV